MNPHWGPPDRQPWNNQPPMIPAEARTDHPARWQTDLAAAITAPEQLLAMLGLPLPEPEALARMQGAAVRFRLRVPRAYVALMEPGNPADPLLRQVLPVAEELLEIPGYVTDPVGDLQVLAGPGLLHKYDGRRLLVTTGACAVHCRYCFRREFPYAEENAAAAGWRPALEALRADPDATEVILSGGDPLALTDSKLERLANELATLPQLRRLRLHTRTPVVLPARVDAALLGWLKRFPLPVVMVLHANHAREFSPALREACAQLRAAGVTLLNQAVLLRGVNDTVAAQVALAEASFDAGVLPYYLHQLDPVRGAAHFQVTDNEALAMHAALVARLPGYLVPRLVRELPGAASKTPVLDSSG